LLIYMEVYNYGAGFTYKEDSVVIDRNLITRCFEYLSHNEGDLLIISDSVTCLLVAEDQVCDFLWRAIKAVTLTDTTSPSLNSQARLSSLHFQSLKRLLDLRSERRWKVQWCSLRTNAHFHMRCVS
jgi:hypothetical protein